jgi:hypothetical protein
MGRQARPEYVRLSSIRDVAQRKWRPFTAGVQCNRLQRGDRSRMGRTGAGARPVLVLYRPEPAAGILGRSPVETIQQGSHRTKPGAHAQSFSKQ